MKVAFFTESLLPHVDGVSLTLARLFGTLEREGVDFRVFSPFQPEEPSWAERVRPVRFFRFPLYPDYRVTIPGGGQTAEALRGYAPDLVHVVSPTPMAIWAQRQAASIGVPVVSSFHTHFVSYFRYYGVPRLEGLGWRYLRWFYGRCRRTYAPSRSISRELGEHGIANVELWERGIDLARFDPGRRDPQLRQRLGVSDEVPMLLMVSRLVAEKDLADLIPMERRLRERQVPHRLVLVGDGPMRDELEAALPDAHFAGHQTGDDLARWYASADVFVFPSTTETFANVVQEARASALPPVVVDRGGPPDQIRHGETGLIARANDPDDLARHVETLLRDPQLRRRMGEQARESARAQDWDAINRRLIDSYRQVVAEGSRSG